MVEGQSSERAVLLGLLPTVPSAVEEIIPRKYDKFWRTSETRCNRLPVPRFPPLALFRFPAVGVEIVHRNARQGNERRTWAHMSSSYLRSADHRAICCTSSISPRSTSTSTSSSTSRARVPYSSTGPYHLVRINLANMATQPPASLVSRRRGASRWWGLRLRRPTEHSPSLHLSMVSPFVALFNPPLSFVRAEYMHTHF